MNRKLDILKHYPFNFNFRFSTDEINSMLKSERTIRGLTIADRKVKHLPAIRKIDVCLYKDEDVEFLTILLGRLLVHSNLDEVRRLAKLGIFYESATVQFSLNPSIFDMFTSFYEGLNILDEYPIYKRGDAVNSFIDFAVENKLYDTEKESFLYSSIAIIKIANSPSNLNIGEIFEYGISQGF